jgi:capsular polysaccharide biosynthesis protein
MIPTNTQPHQPAPFDVWAVLDFWLRRWRWLAFWTIALAIAGFFVARAQWERSYTSSAQLIHYQPSSVDDTYRPRALAPPSLIVMLQSPGFFSEVGAQLQPPLTAKQLFSRLQINLDRNNDVATVTAVGSSAAETVDLVQRFCDAAILYTQKMQQREATEAGETVNRQLTQVESEIALARSAIPAASVANVAALAEAPEGPVIIASDLPQRLQTARNQLEESLIRFTDDYPLVREQRARVAGLEEAQRRAAAERPPIRRPVREWPPRRRWRRLSLAGSRPRRSRWANGSAASRLIAPCSSGASARLCRFARTRRATFACCSAPPRTRPSNTVTGWSLCCA